LADLDFGIYRIMNLRRVAVTCFLAGELLPQVRAALLPEERWWLFAMTVAEAGLPEDGERGWRRALYAALSDGNADAPARKRRRPAAEGELPALPLFEVRA